MKYITTEEIGMGGSKVGYQNLPEYILNALIESGGKLGVPVPGIDPKLEIMIQAPFKLGILEENTLIIRHASLQHTFPLPEDVNHQEITANYLSKNPGVLGTIRPHLICIEAASQFKNRISSRSRVLESYLDKNPETNLLVMGRGNPRNYDFYSRLQDRYSP